MVVVLKKSLLTFMSMLLLQMHDYDNNGINKYY